MKRKIYFALSIIFTTLFAILFHKFLPSDANSSNANSILVQNFGFPVVAIFYFFILFCLCSFSIYHLGLKSQLSKRDIFLRFGIGYGMLYFIGMFEIVPGIAWNVSVGINQIAVGIGDAIPAIVISFLISRLIPHESRISRSFFNKEIISLIVYVAIINFVLRMIGYSTGIIDSAINDYCIPVIIWTILFSITLGIVIAILYPFFHDGSKFMVSRVLISFGLNWFWFNSFMALIMKGLMGTIIIRVTVDLLGIICSILIYRRYSNMKINKKSIKSL